MTLNGQTTAVTSVSENEAAVTNLLWYEEEGRLIALTKDCLLSQYFVVPGAPSLERVSQVKLSISSAAVREGVYRSTGLIFLCFASLCNRIIEGIKSAIWTGRPGLLTTCAETENLVRFWDLSNDENYVLTLRSNSVDQ